MKELLVSLKEYCLYGPKIVVWTAITMFFIAFLKLTFNINNAIYWNAIYWLFYSPALFLSIANCICVICSKGAKQYILELFIFEKYTKLITLNKAVFYGVLVPNAKWDINERAKNIYRFKTDIKKSIKNKGIECRMFSLPMPEYWNNWSFIELAILNPKDINLFRLTLSDEYDLIDHELLKYTINAHNKGEF